MTETQTAATVIDLAVAQRRRAARRTGEVQLTIRENYEHERTTEV